VAARGNLSKNFVSAIERGAKGFSIDSFLHYVQGLGISAHRVFVPDEDQGRSLEALAPEAQTVGQSRQALSAADQQRLARCLSYLQAPEAEIRALAQTQLDVLEDAVYARRLKRGDELSAEASDPPAS
jgi:hypothetical protein